jgi:hypothetical protein
MCRGCLQRCVGNISPPSGVLLNAPYKFRGPTRQNWRCTCQPYAVRVLSFCPPPNSKLYAPSYRPAVAYLTQTFPLAPSHTQMRRASDAIQAIVPGKYIDRNNQDRCANEATTAILFLDLVSPEPIGDQLVNAHAYLAHGSAPSLWKVWAILLGEIGRGSPCSPGPAVVATGAA